MFRTYKYLLRPNTEQIKILDFLIWQFLVVYNAALEQRITTYKETGKGVGYGAQWVHYRDVRHDNPQTLGKLNAASLQHLLRRLDKSFAAFFRRLKAAEKPGFPRFKSRNRFNSLEYTYGDGCKLRQDEYGRKSFYVQNVGETRMCYHRAIPTDAEIKHVVIKRDGERWYVCLMLKLPDPSKRQAQTGQQVGIDVGLKNRCGTLYRRVDWRPPLVEREPCGTAKVATPCCSAGQGEQQAKRNLSPNRAVARASCQSTSRLFAQGQHSAYRRERPDCD